MSNVISFEGAVSRLASQADAVGRLAQDSGAFAAVVAAFESNDPDAFRWVLDRLEMLPYCELICEWVRVKICVLRCFEVCGPPPEEKIETPSLQEFAHAVVKLASNEKLLRRVVDAVSCGDGDDYRAAIQELELNRFCHLICHWVCSIIYRRVCERVCTPTPGPVRDPAGEIRASSRVIASLIANEKAFHAISEAAVELNCITLQSSIEQAGFGPNCEIICCFVCFWRCVWVCREVCRVVDPPRTGASGVEEARNFALASRQLATQPRALGDLVSAVQKRDAQAYSETISRLGLGPYCYQVCGWVCAGICYEFCICVCPNPAPDPWFITVGNFNIYSDIDGTSGKTNKALPTSIDMPFGGGPNFAFFEQLVLGGFCPIDSPTSPGTQMQYRFLYAAASTTLSAAINAAQTTIHVASSAGVPPTPFNVSVCSNSQTGETMTVTGVVVTTWTVVRGVDGTTAASALLGASVWVNPTPIAGPLVCKTKLGSRFTPWPQVIAGIAQAALVPTFQDVWVSPTAIPDTPPPAPLTFWVGPGIHYIQADPTTGWVPVDLNTIGLGFQTLMCFDTTQAVATGCPLPTPPCIGTPGGTPAGSAVPAAGQGAGTDLAIIFQATRVGALPVVDFSNSLCKIHVNNWSEVNNLWFLEFTLGAGCCQPIDTKLSVEFTVDHEEMDSGAWSLGITSCSGSAPGDITPLVSSGGPPPVTVSPRGGFGTIVENTTTWTNCSYVVSLVTRPGLTTGLSDREAIDNQLTFCICGHKS